MAKKGSEKSKPKKSAAGKKGKSKSKIKKYLAITALLIVAGLAYYQFFYKNKNLPAPIKASIDTIEKIWPDSEKQTITAEKKLDNVQTVKQIDQPVIFKEKMSDFADAVTPVVKKLINLPYRLGADPVKDHATDNSHLIFSIWEQSAKSCGLSIGKYRPMLDLIADCREIQLSELSNGDLIVLNDGNAGLIYGFGGDSDGFYLIYTSQSQKKVVSVSSQELRKYWLNPQNKKGYYRATQKIFSE